MILAIESSCDESALALFDPTKGMAREIISSQAAAHEKFGGVVPDLASRMHLSALPLLLEEFRADIPKITTLAVTRGPGLLPCLSMGISMTRALSVALGCPIQTVNHLRAHVHSVFINLHAAHPSQFTQARAELLPHLGLVVSGGNTLLVKLDTDLKITVIARTVDDAAGEAFDKGAKLLGLPYPGGALIEQLAQKGNVQSFAFPRGLLEKSDLRFSFSGLKTALRYQLEKMSDEEVKSQLPSLCASYQDAILGQLNAKMLSALNLESFKSVGLSGGVANNRALRSLLAQTLEKRKLPLLVAEPKYCGDNAGMIAFAAWADPYGAKSGTVEPAPQLSIDLA